MESLIIDANCFIHNIEELKGFIGKRKLYTTNGVIGELK